MLNYFWPDTEIRGMVLKKNCYVYNPGFTGGALKQRLILLVLAIVSSVTFFSARPLYAQCCLPPAWSCGALSNWGLSLYTGYMGSATGADILFTAVNPQTAGSLNSIRQNYKLQGINLDLMAPMRLYGPYGLGIGAGYTVCFNSPSDEALLFASSDPVNRSWLAKPQIFNLQAALTMDFSASFVGILGVRYENFATNFVNAESTVNGYGGGRNSVDFTLSSYIPTIGLMYSGQSQSSSSNFRVGVTGFPLLLGSVNYRESVVGGITIGGRGGMPGFQGSDNITSGYYINAFADGAITVAETFRLAIYSKYDILNATSNDLLTGAYNADVPNVHFNFNFQRSNWGVGLRASVGF